MHIIDMQCRYDRRVCLVFLFIPVCIYVRLPWARKSCLPQMEQAVQWQLACQCEFQPAPREGLPGKYSSELQSPIAKPPVENCQAKVQIQITSDSWCWTKNGKPCLYPAASRPFIPFPSLSITFHHFSFTSSSHHFIITLVITSFHLLYIIVQGSFRCRSSNLTPSLH